MRCIFLLIFVLLFTKPVISKNIFEITLLATAIPLLYDQYFDNSLSEETKYNKTNKILEQQTRGKLKISEKINVGSRSDLIYYLTVIEELELYSNSY